MDGMIKVHYTIMCKNDTHITIKLSELLKNDKIAKTIKSEYAKGLRNLTVHSDDESEVLIRTEKKVFEFTVGKNDFADLLELAEEDARKHKRLKKECDGVALVDIQTID